MNTKSVFPCPPGSLPHQRRVATRIGEEEFFHAYGSLVQGLTAYSLEQLEELQQKNETRADLPSGYTDAMNTAIEAARRLKVREQLEIEKTTSAN